MTYRHHLLPALPILLQAGNKDFRWAGGQGQVTKSQVSPVKVESIKGFKQGSEAIRFHFISITPASYLWQTGQKWVTRQDWGSTSPMTEYTHTHPHIALACETSLIRPPKIRFCILLQFSNIKRLTVSKSAFQSSQFSFQFVPMASGHIFSL